MEQVTGFVVLCVLTVLTACVATLPGGARAGSDRQVWGNGGSDPVARLQTSTTPPPPVVRVDQPLQPLGPPTSRVRSPVLDQALSANSNAAIIMFLLRNPGDPFTDQAVISLNARRTPDSAQALQAAAGGDAALVGAFDAARLANTDAAWVDFLARHGGSPLAAMVPLFR